MKSAAVTLRFTELLSALLKGKTSLVDALQILAREGIDSQVRDSAVKLLSAMKKGKGLSEGLRTMKDGRVFFESLYLSLINAAELTGSVEQVLNRIAMDMRRKQKAKENVINILIYPSIIIFLAIAGTVIIILKVIPFFISGGLVSGDVISNAKAGICIAFIVLLTGGAALFIIYYRIFYRDSPEFRIFYLLDFLLSSNITLPEALSQCVMNMADTKYGNALVRIKNDIASGIPFSTAFSRIKYFPLYVLEWLSVANVHGNIRDSCGTIKDHFAQKDDKAREAAAKLIEPAVIILTGAYILIIMVTALLPILTYAGGII